MKIMRSGLMACASLAFVAGSSPSHAQPDPEQYCSQYAWNYCSYDPHTGQPIQVTFECWEAAFNDCMSIYGGGGLGAYVRDRMDRAST